MTSTTTKPATPTNASNRPVERIKVGVVQAAIWMNRGANGSVYSATFQRSYRDPKTNGWKSSTSFGTGELLQLSTAANRAHSRILVLREAERQQDQSVIPTSANTTDRKQRPANSDNPPAGPASAHAKPQTFTAKAAQAAKGRTR